MPDRSSEPRRLQLETADGASLSALSLVPPRARWLYIFAHGAGAGMEHRFMEALAAALAARAVATLRFNFPYIEAGRRRPGPPAQQQAAIRAAVARAAELAPDLPLIAGGKSMGGRMTSLACSERPLPRVSGLAFVGFPLHAPGRPGRARADHLQRVELPMLFAQGTRDKLADLGLIREVISELGDRATLAVIEGADHGFHVLKRSGRTDEQVLEQLAERFCNWADGLPPVPADTEVVA